jgi:hypothetical protein
LWLIVTLLLAVVLAINWIALAVHIHDLRASAAQSTGDSALELHARAEDFRPAEMMFGVLTLFVALVVLGLVTRTLVGRSRTKSAATGKLPDE